jgi:hypothetical protein
MSDLSPEMVLWVARRRAEKAAQEEIDGYLAAAEINRPHRPKLECPRCTRRYYEAGKSNGQCAVCITELEHRDSFQLALEDIAP